MNYLAVDPVPPATTPAATTTTDTTLDKDKNDVEKKLEKAKNLAHQKLVEAKKEAEKKVDIGGHKVALWVPVLSGIVGFIVLVVVGYFAWKHFNKD